MFGYGDSHDTAFAPLLPTIRAKGSWYSLQIKLLSSRICMATEHLSKARWRAWMYPEGAHELEHKFEQAFGTAAMGVAYAYLFEKVQFKTAHCTKTLLLELRYVNNTVGHFNPNRDACSPTRFSKWGSHPTTQFNSACGYG